MAVRTKQIASGVLGTSTGGYYECPAGRTAIIKQITLFNPVAGATTTPIITVVTNSGNRVIFRQSMLAGEVLRVGELFIVLNPGDEITASVSVNSSVTMTVSGAELVGVAD